MKKEIISKIKKTIEVLATPVVAVCAIWGIDVSAIVAATSVFLISALTYAEFWIDYKESK